MSSVLKKLKSYPPPKKKKVLASISDWIEAEMFIIINELQIPEFIHKFTLAQIDGPE